MLYVSTLLWPERVPVWSVSTYGSPGCHAIETLGDGHDRIVPFASDLTVTFS